MQQDLTHIGFGDRAIGAKGDVDDGLGAWDFDGYGAAAGCRACEERSRNDGVICRRVDADDGHGDRGSGYGLGASENVCQI